MNAFKSIKRSYPNVKLLFSIGGGTQVATNAFRAFATSPSKRSSFVTNVLNYIRNNNLDGGILIKVQYPNAKFNFNHNS